jgi:hypothetical protein
MALVVQHGEANRPLERRYAHPGLADHHVAVYAGIRRRLNQVRQRPRWHRLANLAPMR